MTMPQRFSVPWATVDPLFRNGGIEGELEGMFVAPDLGDNWKTLNMDNKKIMTALNNVAASLSMHPDAESEAYPTRNFVQEVLKGINYVAEEITDVTRSSANKHFAWTHAIPPVELYALRPIRFPLRNPFANETLHYFIGDQVECAELNRNCAHSGLTPRESDILLGALFEVKGKVMKLYFDIEISGELSMAEVEQLMEGKYRPGPTVSPPDETGERPATKDVETALTGTDIMQWYPNDEDWVVFGRLRDNRYRAERIYQPEGARQTTEDVAHEQRITTDGNVATPTSTSGPSM